MPLRRISVRFVVVCFPSLFVFSSPNTELDLLNLCFSSLSSSAGAELDKTHFRLIASVITPELSASAGMHVWRWRM